MWSLKRRVPPTTPTRAPHTLGAIAANLVTMEIERLLTGGIDGSIVGLEAFHDLRSRMGHVSRLDRSRHCRFDHAGGGGRPIEDLTVDEVFTMVPAAVRLRVLGRVLVLSGNCSHCGMATVGTSRFVAGLAAWSAKCPTCGHALVASVLDLGDSRDPSALRLELGGFRLGELGVREGDLVMVETRGGDHVLLERRSEQPCGEAPAGRTVVVVGLGNIGSHLVDSLLHLPAPSLHEDKGVRLDRLVLVDPDTYEAANLAGQRIDPCEVGVPKALAQARRVRRSRPFVSVAAYVSRIEDLPPLVLRGAIVAGCVDSRAARMATAEAAWRVGVPYVDAAVDATACAVRIAGYAFGPANACLECSWHDDDYAALEQRVPCQQ